MKKSLMILALCASISVAGFPALTYAQYGGGGPPVGLFGFISGGGSTGGSVLGASTSTVPVDFSSGKCGALLTTYMRRGMNNNPVEVKKLQLFLNQNLGLTLPISGYFGIATENAVKQFQAKYASTVLGRWGITQPTGYVFKTTLHEINKIYCTTLNAPEPVL